MVCPLFAQPALRYAGERVEAIRLEEYLYHWPKTGARVTFAFNPKRIVFYRMGSSGEHLADHDQNADYDHRGRKQRKSRDQSAVCKTGKRRTVEPVLEIEQAEHSAQNAHTC